ncbi:MAG TPA: hypothetical protein VNP04_30405 [Alphaproteobacteria bacterium]|nr:hypothetical protein [Alphaproteobacteria bacterium]
MALVISVETFPALRIPVQTLPPATVMAAITLPLVYLRAQPKKSRPLWALMAFLCWALLISLVGLLWDLNVSEAPPFRLIAFLRQAVGLLLGLSVFLVGRRIAAAVPLRRLMLFMVWGTIPSIAVGILEAVSIVTGSSRLTAILEFGRRFLVPSGYLDVARVSGLSSEPSHYGFFAGAFALPVLFASWRTQLIHRGWLLLLLGALLASVLYTNSTVSLFAVYVFLLLSAVLGPARKLAVALSLVLTVALAAVVASGGGWYLTYQIGAIAGGSPTVSFTTRAFSTLGPVLALRENPWGAVGFGLGGVSTHYQDILSEDVAQQMGEVSREGIPALKTLWGKVIAETGIVGALLFGVFVVASMGSAVRTSRMARDHGLVYGGRLIALGIVTCALVQAVGFGAYTFPYLWLWAGLGDGVWTLTRARQRIC